MNDNKILEKKVFQKDSKVFALQRSNRNLCKDEDSWEEENQA